MMRHLAAACAAASVACAQGTALAFDSDEHEKISNLGLRVAMAYLRTQNAPPEAALAAAAELEGEPGKYEKFGNAKWRSEAERKKLSYGDITACVDYFLNPEMLLAELQSAPESPAFDLSRCRGGFGAGFVQATHTNHAHFQRGALLSYQVLHDAALAAVASAKALREPAQAVQQRLEWRRALILNALAEHYLQDFLAPGHVRTKRRALSDVVATAMHDRYNDNDFAPRVLLRPNLLKLRPLAGLLCAGESRNPCHLRPGLEALLAKGEGAAQIGQALVDLIDKGETIEPKGDALLWNPQPEQRKQRLLLVLSSAASILDLLDSGQSAFWHEWREDNDEPRVARMTYAGYEFSEPRIPGAGFGIADMSRVIGISVARETLLTNSRAGRTAVTAEWAQGLGLGLFGRKGNFIPTLGGTCYVEGAVNGCGPVARLSYVVPETEIAAGIYTRWLAYPDPEAGRDTRRNSTGVRVDMGFSSYLTLFVAYGKDYATAQELGRLDKGRMLFVGAELLFPTSQLWRLLGRLRDSAAEAP